MKIEQEGREPGEEQAVFTAIHFGPSTSSSSSSSVASVSEKCCIAESRKRESVTMSSEGSKGTGGQALQGGGERGVQPIHEENCSVRVST